MFDICTTSTAQSTRPRNSYRRSTKQIVVCLMSVLCLVAPWRFATAAVPPERRTLLSFQSMPRSSIPSSKTATITTRSRFTGTSLAAGGGGAMDDTLERQLAFARELLAKSKAKLQVQQARRREEEEKMLQQESLPFFATLEPISSSEVAQDSADKRAIVTKTRDEKSGLITTDGELMAKLSEGEQWERRSIWEVFDQKELLAESVREEMEKQLQRGDGTKGTSRSLNDRDVAASIFNLRRVLQNEDYKKIFDPKNRFIGEDN